MQQSLSNTDFGLIGYPLEHSFSKKFFTEFFQKSGRQACYDNFPLPELTPQAIYSLVLLNPKLKGFNVTSPYKIAIMDYLDSLSTDAEEVGAVNTVRIRRDETGRFLALEGHNTDVIGFIEAVSQYITPNDTHALILGTGGASKAAETAFKHLNIESLKVSRNPSTNQIGYNNITPELLAKYSIIVNTTPAGMYPNCESYPPFPTELLGPKHFVFDMIYNPEETILLQKASKQGARTSNGLRMLHGQAIASLDFWDSTY